MKNLIDSFGNRAYDLPDCIAMPRPTASPSSSSSDSHLIVCSIFQYWRQTGRILDPYIMSQANYLHEHEIWTHLMTFCHFVYIQCLQICIHPAVKFTIYRTQWIQTYTISVTSIKCSRRWSKLSRENAFHW